MENYCLGKQKFLTPISYKWYYPKDKTAMETSICQWCYENDCVNKENMVLFATEGLEDKKIYASYDCTKEHPTLINKISSVVNEYGIIRCPSCYFKDKIGLNNPFCENNSGNCKFCRAHIFSGSYSTCYKCYVIKNMCFDCNNEIKSGDEYFNEFWDILFKPHVLFVIDGSDGIILSILYKLRNKTAKQVMKLILDGELYKNPKTKYETYDEIYEKEINKTLLNSIEQNISEHNFEVIAKSEINKPINSSIEESDYVVMRWIKNWFG